MKMTQHLTPKKPQNTYLSSDSSEEKFISHEKKKKISQQLSLNNQRQSKEDKVKQWIDSTKTRRFDRKKKSLSSFSQMSKKKKVDSADKSFVENFQKTREDQKDILNISYLTYLDFQINVSEKHKKDRQQFCDFFNQNVSQSQENLKKKSFQNHLKNYGEFYNKFAPEVITSKDDGAISSFIKSAVVKNLEHEQTEKKHFKHYLNIDFQNIENNVLSKIQKNREISQKIYFIDEVAKLIDGEDYKYIPAHNVNNTYKIQSTLIEDASIYMLRPCEDILFTPECSDNLFRITFKRDLTTIARDMVVGGQSHRDELEEIRWGELQKDEIKHKIEDMNIFDCINLLGGRVSTQMTRLFLANDSLKKLFDMEPDESFSNLGSVFSEKTFEEDNEDQNLLINFPTPLDQVELREKLTENPKSEQKAFVYLKQPKPVKQRVERETQLNKHDVNRPASNINTILETIKNIKFSFENSKSLPIVKSSTSYKVKLLNALETVLEDLLNYLFRFVKGNEQMILSSSEKLAKIVNAALTTNKKLFFKNFSYPQLVQLFIKEMILVKTADQIKIVSKNEEEIWFDEKQNSTNLPLFEEISAVKDAMKLKLITPIKF